MQSLLELFNRKMLEILREAKYKCTKASDLEMSFELGSLRVWSQEEHREMRLFYSLLQKRSLELYLHVHSIQEH